MFFYGFCLIIAGICTFALQPLIAKSLLPYLGGSPLVWLMVQSAFQTLLVLGYGFAFLQMRLTKRQQLMTQCGLIFVGMVLWFLSDMLWQRYVGLSLLTLWLFSLSPLLHHWMHQLSVNDDPFWLYIASNVGCLAGLFAVPLLLEPTLALEHSLLLWVGIVGGLCPFVGWLLLRRQQIQVSQEFFRWKEIRYDWIVWACVATMLLGSETFYVSQDLNAVPLLWAMYLGIYLVCIALAFRQPVWLQRLSQRSLLFMGMVGVGLSFIAYHIDQYSVFALALMPIGATWEEGTNLFFQLKGILHVMGYALVLLAVVRELAMSKPRQGSHSYPYLFSMAIGGALGGILTAWIFPALFKSFYELNAVYLIIGGLMVWPSLTRSMIKSFVLFLGSVIAVWLSYRLWSVWAGHWTLELSVLLLFFIGYYGQQKNVVWFVAWCFIMLLPPFSVGARNIIYQHRSYYGSLRVEERKEHTTYHLLMYGSTVHGIQDSKRPRSTLSYYHPSTSLAQAYQELTAKPEINRVGIIGLGTGSMACLTPESKELHYYELDPAMLALSTGTQSYFSFLSECSSQVDWTIGDARLSLKKEQEQSQELYDVLVVDAFQSDAIPTHLLTKEAVELYLQRLTPNGAIIFHLSHRTLNLDREMARIADKLGLVLVGKLSEPHADQADASPTLTAVLLKQPSDEAWFLENGWTRLHEPKGREWTDQFTPMMRAFFQPSLVEPTSIK